MSDDNATLSQLLLRFFETNPDRLGDFGGTPETTPADLVTAVLADKFQSPVTPAKTLLQAFDKDQDPTAKEIAALLRRIVG